MYNDLEDDYVEYLVCGIKSCRVYLYKFYQRSRRENHVFNSTRAPCILDGPAWGSKRNPTEKCRKEMSASVALKFLKSKRKFFLQLRPDPGTRSLENDFPAWVIADCEREMVKMLIAQPSFNTSQLSWSMWDLHWQTYRYFFFILIIRK